MAALVTSFWWHLARRAGSGFLLMLLVLRPMDGHAGVVPPADPDRPLTFVQLSRGFEEPLVPTSIRSVEEDAALDRAVDAYQSRTVIDDFGALESFLAAHPASPWRLALLTNLGLAYYQHGYFDRAISALEQAWLVGRDVTDAQAKPLADRAAGELLKMHARLGHADRLAALLAEMDTRDFTGSATELHDGAKQGLWTMHHRPGVAYLCGPSALRNLLLARGVPAERLAFLDRYESSTHGVTLAEVGRLADQAQLPHLLVRRSADQPVPVPSIIHWKVNHFAAVIAERDGRYQLEDPTFGNTLWVSRKAIDTEGSGYFLVPDPPAHPTWQVATASEAETVFGMGQTGSNAPGAVTSGDANAQGQTGNNPCLCGYAFKELNVSLNLTDTPVGYTPPVGPAIPITVSYNQREAGQPATFSFWNLGQKWSMNWLSYITDDPTMPGASVVRNVGGGGEISETGFNTATGQFAPETYDNAFLTLASANPVVYTRSLPDGSVETYSQSNGATSGPRYVFLKAVTDPYGNSAVLNYDTQLRLSSITDATGQATTFVYGNSSFPLQVTEVDDPFGHRAKLQYDTSGRLKQITDAQGLISSFGYGTGMFVKTLTTPYGVTQFSGGDNGNARFLQATDPLSKTERLEFNQDGSVTGVQPSDPANTVPTGMTQLVNDLHQFRNTFYWDKHAYAVAPGDYGKARLRHWAHLMTDLSVTSDFLESEKYPLENRVWFNYPGQLSGKGSGTLNRPSAIGRVLDDGSTQLTKFAYNTFGNLTRRVDPVGRETDIVYAPNLIDVMAVQQMQGQTPVTTASFTYDGHHRPRTSTDAAGQTTQYTYNGVEQLSTVTNPLNQTTTYRYNSNSRLSTVLNADNVIARKLAYGSDSYLKTDTDSEGYTIQYVYDGLGRVTQQTFPDGTTRLFNYLVLDLHTVTDRQNRTTTYDHDSVRNLTAVTDPLNHVTKYGYYENGTLATLTDPNNNLTQWAIDVQSRVTGKQYADSSVVTYGYEATTSRLHATIDALGQEKDTTYTADNRIAGISYLHALNPTPSVGFTYGPFFPLLKTMTDGSGMTTYAYNPVGSLGALQVSVEQPAASNSAIFYTYDQLGRLVTRKIAGDTEMFGYDAIGRLSGHADDLGTFVRTYLGETSQLASQTNSVVGTAWSYDTNLRDRKLIGVTNTPGTVGGVRNASAYTFQNALEGDITQIVDAYNSQTLTPGYDAADRLQGVTSPGTYNYGYTYDPADNITGITRRSAQVTITPNTLNQAVMYGSVKLSYDLNGNLVRDATSNYAWDAENRLVTITNRASGDQNFFRYDGLGRRIVIGSVSGGLSSETHYGWCGTVLCAARTGTDVILRRYFLEGEATPAQNQLAYYAVDQIGSVRDALDASSGASMAHYDYDPYGAPLGRPTASITDYRFAGLLYHQPSGLYLSNTRPYDPTDGRWLARDPISEAGGVNLYGYVGNNPVNEVDPSGTQAVPGAVVGGLVGGVTGYFATGTVRGTVTGLVAGAAAGGISVFASEGAAAAVLAAGGGAVAQGIAAGASVSAIGAVAGGGAAAALGQNVTSGAIIGGLAPVLSGEAVIGGFVVGEGTQLGIATNSALSINSGIVGFAGGLIPTESGSNVGGLYIGAGAFSPIPSGTVGSCR